MIAALPLVTSALSLFAPSTSTPSTAAASPAPGADFGSVMNKVSNDAMQSIKHAEQLATDGLQGKADTQSVVQAVMTAQENLQTKSQPNTTIAGTEAGR